MDFPAEEYLVNPPPNYPLERFFTIVKLSLVFVFFIVILPYMLAKPIKEDDAVKKKRKARTEDSPKTISPKTKKKKSPAKEQQATEEDEPVQYELGQFAIMQCCAFCMISFLWVALKSNPHNYFTTRGVFQAPMLTRSECDEILQMAQRASETNYKEAKSMEGMYSLFAPEDDDEGLNKTMRGLLEEPLGWQKYRHGSYPTTDLNLVTDPFTKEDRSYIKEKMDARLAPLISRIFGVPVKSLRANDMFVVRYDDGRRAHLSNHTDDADISFNILLNDGFEGGGTQFWNREAESPFAWVTPKQVGQVLLHSAMINHEGKPISKGTRTILVGFMSVDRVDPFNNEHTGLTFLASWGNLNWLSVKFKEGVRASKMRLAVTLEHSWRNHVLVRSFFDDCLEILSRLGDVMLPHFVTNFVHPKDRTKYLEALDKAYFETPRQVREEGGRKNGFPEWFVGQQINIDITGEVSTYWQTRLTNEHRFMSSDL